MKKIRLTIWNEFRHEQNLRNTPTDARAREIYPEGMHRQIARGLGDRYDIAFATLDMPEHGLTEDILARTDVLMWWAHIAHSEVRDEVVDRVQQRVLDGMGLICLHAAHHSKIFRRLMGTSGNLRWRDIGERERVWVLEPHHPITRGLPPYFELAQEEMYGERFDIPDPDKVLFISWFEGGEVFRSGVTYTRGLGKIFYFRPGHETYPTYHDPVIARVLDNAVEWAAFAGTDEVMKGAPHIRIPPSPVAVGENH
ncbi:MAG: ThuA domain-containing protein [Kiritimatiellia bacterium]|nr:ThuA domain-containing protein [Kiritimatiellia bacterium]